ncbi:MAG: hypothetical protein EPN82_12815 [Bacteroidetes bacterium]|nr:MAG: hypothetical protein EPN82_12815 [Bacteroidota bacterium]
MTWSISSYREFLKCQRKWFFNNKVGSRSLKDTFRREVHLLSELESIDGWRGKIVDYTISEFIVPKLQKKQSINSSEVIEYANKLSKARFEFAKAQRYKEKDLKKTEHDYDYSALFYFEYLESTEEFQSKKIKAWNEIKIALNNFLNNEEILNYLRTAFYLVKQRTLQFKIHDFNIKGVPDLIAFFKNGPPHIFDWKVHYFGTKNYNEQLLIYASALFNCNPHKDFPNDITKYSIYDIKLSEYQLLKNTIRSYSINDECIEDINYYLAEGIEKMKLNNCEKKYEELNIEHFEKTQNLDNCVLCSFKRICKEN